MHKALFSHTKFFIHLVATKDVENRVQKQQYENSINALTQRKQIIQSLLHQHSDRMDPQPRVL